MDWAELDIKLGVIRRLTPGCFYALMLAPLMSDWATDPTSASSMTEEAAETEMRLSVFADAALTGIQAEQALCRSTKKKAKSARKPVSPPEKQQPDLLGRTE